jgi:hypothetical protein
MDPAQIILNSPLGIAFQPSRPILITCERVVLDFRIVIAGPAPVSVLWYPEYTVDNPYATATEWFREVAEEDIGNGDVRMPFTIRRFSTEGADAALPAGTHRFAVQLKRIHDIARIQMAGVGAQVLVYSVFGQVPPAP